MSVVHWILLVFLAVVVNCHLDDGNSITEEEFIVTETDGDSWNISDTLPRFLWNTTAVEYLTHQSIMAKAAIFGPKQLEPHLRNWIQRQPNDVQHEFYDFRERISVIRSEADRRNVSREEMSYALLALTQLIEESPLSKTEEIKQVGEFLAGYSEDMAELLWELLKLMRPGYANLANRPIGGTGNPDDGPVGHVSNRQHYPFRKSLTNSRIARSQGTDSPVPGIFRLINSMIL